jgi:apolipoprotein N-acyltransferase
MNKYTLTGFSVAGGILTGLAWTDWCSGLILLVSLTPFLFIENHIFKNPREYTVNSYFLYLLPGFVIFGLLTIGWIRVISVAAAICVVMCVAFLMSLTIWAAHIIRIKAGNLVGAFAFIVLWLSMEFVCLKINLLSPWLNLGNGLSKDILFIQWYEVTGTAGGTMWILLSNLTFLGFLTGASGKKRNSVFLFIIWIMILIVPSAFSVYRYRSVSSSTKHQAEVVVVQPNFDPYNEKYTIPFEIQLDKTLSLAGSAVTEKTLWVVTPETTIDDPVNENCIENDRYIVMLRQFNRKHPGISVVTGMVTWKPEPAGTGNNQKAESDYKNITGYSLRFNSAVKTDTSPNIEINHKSKLVPGFENAGSGNLLNLAKRILPDLGGTVWGYGIQNERECFTSPKSFTVAPVICYESVYGEYVSEYIKKGAEAIFIITNDGWWKNTHGYEQHLHYASLRAIETRRPVVRAANTGISCFIDLKGQITSRTEWWKKDVLKEVISPESAITPYVRYGDVILYLSVIMSILLFFLVFFIKPFIDRTEKF